MRTAGLLAAVALLAAGCGGGAKLSVARIGTTTATTTASPPAPTAEWVEYSGCLDSHGAPNTPARDGGILLDGGGDPTSLAAAQKACRSLLPAGGAPRRLTRSQMTAWLRYSACMRQHGVLDFPDPEFVDGDTGVVLDARGVDPHAPVFHAASAACRDSFPLRKLRHS